jgi:hypothetical protein
MGGTDVFTEVRNRNLGKEIVALKIMHYINNSLASYHICFVLVYSLMLATYASNSARLSCTL